MNAYLIWGNMFVTALYSCVLFCFVVDINECQEGTSGCPQQCDNTEGAFICSCFPGFELNHDNKTCEQTGIACLRL